MFREIIAWRIITKTRFTVAAFRKVRLGALGRISRATLEIIGEIIPEKFFKSRKKIEKKKIGETLNNILEIWLKFAEEQLKEFPHKFS